MLIPQGGVFTTEQIQHAHRFVGHDHFWERALSRRAFVGMAAGASAAMLASNLWMPALAHATDLHRGAAPRPIPGGIQPFGPGTEVFHVFGPAPGAEPSTITDFAGVIGVAVIDGTGTAENTQTGAHFPLVFDVDQRFFQGRYVGLDGHVHRATFVFI